MQWLNVVHSFSRSVSLPAQLRTFFESVLLGRMGALVTPKMAKSPSPVTTDTEQKIPDFSHIIIYVWRFKWSCLLSQNFSNNWITLICICYTDISRSDALLTELGVILVEFYLSVLSEKINQFISCIVKCNQSRKRWSWLFEGKHLRNIKFIHKSNPPRPQAPALLIIIRISPPLSGRKLAKNRDCYRWNTRKSKLDLSHFCRVIRWFNSVCFTRRSRQQRSVWNANLSVCCRSLRAFFSARNFNGSFVEKSVLFYIEVDLNRLRYWLLILLIN